jgi:hypothetical protein
MKKYFLKKDILSANLKKGECFYESEKHRNKYGASTALIYKSKKDHSLLRIRKKDLIEFNLLESNIRNVRVFKIKNLEFINENSI